MNRKVNNLILLISVIAMLIIAACSSAETVDTGSKTTGSLKVGLIAPLSGDAASYGESVRKGVELSKKESSANIELIFEDTKCDGKESVTGTNKLVSENKVQAIIGEVCSGATIPAGEIAQQNQVVIISPASTNPTISDLGDYVFRTVPSDLLQGNFAANMVSKDGLKKAATFYTNEPYGKGLSTVFEESFEKLGGEIVASESVER